MKVLWITYCDFAEATSLSEVRKINRTSGGWLEAAANSMALKTNVELRIASVSRSNSDFKIVAGNRIIYYLIPYHRGVDTYHHDYDNYWKKIVSEFEPDIVHIHGLESSLALSYIRLFGAERVVISIQGLAGIISRHYNEGLSAWDIIRNISLADILRRKTLFTYQREFYNKGKLEIETLQEAKHIIGRTQWDKIHTTCINSKLTYHFCNETMRNVFYSDKWEYSKCRKHTIFLSSMSAPFKGAHFVFMALPLILQKYPDVKVRIAGNSLLFSTSIKDKLKKGGYQRFLCRLIKKLNVENNIEVLGPLSAIEMKDEYLSANVFICPSSMENSSNSISEAQLLGVPVVASYVGGSPDLVPNNSSGIFFQSGDYEMLASIVCDIFDNSSTFDNTEERLIAYKRHNPIQNALKTIKIYNSILNLTK